MRTRGAFYLRFFVFLVLLSAAQSACTGEAYVPIDAADAGPTNQADTADACFCDAHGSTPSDAQSAADAPGPLPEDTRDEVAPDAAAPDTVSPPEEDSGADEPDVPDTPPTPTTAA